MYIDFDPKKLGEELKEKTFNDLSGQGIPPAVSGQGIAPGGCVDPSTGEDGGGVVTQAAMIDAHGNTYPEDGGGPQPFCGTTG